MNKIAGRLTLAGILFLFLISSCSKSNKEEDNSCKEVSSTGKINIVKGTDTYTVSFRTSGGGTIKMELGPGSSYRSIIIGHADYSNFTIELWGDTMVNGLLKTAANHESLNGKHIKDRLDKRRSFLFPDGAKLTLDSEGPYGPLKMISIYDGAESHQINPRCNTLIHSSTDEAVAKKLDDAEVDGETASFEITTTGLLFFNIYTEDTPGNKAGARVELGELSKDNPNMVNDYFDDPRFGST